MTGCLKIKGDLRVLCDASSEPVRHKDMHLCHSQSEGNSLFTVTWRTNRTVAEAFSFKARSDDGESKDQEALG